MICFERENRPFQAKLRMPSFVEEKILPYLSKLWNPLPIANDHSVSLNYLQTQFGRNNSSMLTEICDVIFSEEVDSKNLTRGFKLLKDLEFGGTCANQRSYLSNHFLTTLSDVSSSLGLLAPLIYAEPSLAKNIDLCKMSLNVKSHSLRETSNSKPTSVTSSCSDLISRQNCKDTTDQNLKTAICIVETALDIDKFHSKMPVVPSAGGDSASTVPAIQKGKRIATMETVTNHLIQRKSQKMNRNTKKRRRRQKKQKPIRAQNDQLGSKCDQMMEQSPSEADIESSLWGSPPVYGQDFSIGIECTEVSTPQELPQRIPFILEHFIDSGTDEDWDCDESLGDERFCHDFEFPSLMTGLSSIHISGATSLNIGCAAVVSGTGGNSCHIEIEIELSSELQEVNDNWEKLMSDVSPYEKEPEKVTFAKDEELVTLHPVESYDRKGEWEIYALERFRFKKRIDEVEEILAPCLQPNHRQKVWEQMKNSNSNNL